MHLRYPVLRLLTRAFAIIGVLVTILIILGVVAAVRMQAKALKEPANVILTLDFDQPIVEQNDPSPFDLAMHEDTVPLLDILRAIDKAKDDPHVKAIVAHFGGSQPSLAQVQEIRDALARFHTSGKPMYAFGASYGSFGMGNRDYYLASTFNSIWLQPVGSVGLTGLAIQSPFAKSALDKIGVTADFMQREEYKSFMEMGMRDDFSQPARENMQSLIDDLANQEANGIAGDHQWKVDHVKELMAKGPYTDDESLKEGLVTKIGYADELQKEIEQKAGVGAVQVDPSTYLGYSSAQEKLLNKTKPKATIALVYGTGLIVDKADGAGSLSGEKMMGADDIAEAFNDIAKSKTVKAVLFRVDSPGGSPEASETIRRAMMHAQQSGKPVFVSMGEVAASGGYWISMNADYIVAQPGTLTGSIGVVGGKFAIGGLLQKIGVNIGTIKTAESADIWSASNTFSPEQRERVNALLDNSYHTFVQDVSTARKIPIDKMPEIAKGRVWTGAQAAKNGLVDDLGGYDVTLAAIRKKLNLGDNDEVAIELFPAPETAVERLQKLLKEFGVESAMVHSTLGEWQKIEAALGPLSNGMSGFNQPVSARMPLLTLH